MSSLSRFAEGVAPLWFWRYRARRWLAGIVGERELVLIPHVCDPRKTSLDVGASLGVYTIHMLGYSRNCIAFEPRAEAAAELRRVFKTRRLRIEEDALSDATGEASFRIPTNDTGRSTLEVSNSLERTDTVTVVSVQMRRLDDYGLSHVGFIKIDVEGHELAVLRGAGETIKRCRPAFLIEIEERHNPGSLAAVEQWLAALGYTGWFLEGNSLAPMGKLTPAHKDRESRAAGQYVYNFLFLRPEHKLPSIQRRP